MDPKKYHTFNTLGSKAVPYINHLSSVKWENELLGFAAHLKNAVWWKWIKFILVVPFFTLPPLQSILACVNINKTVALNGLGNMAKDPYWPWLVVLIPLWIFNFLLLVQLCCFMSQIAVAVIATTTIL